MNKVKTLITGAVLAFAAGTSTIASAACDKPFGAQRRTCDISSYLVISWLGEPADIQAKGGTNTHDILLFTIDGSGKEIRIAEVSFWERDWADVPRNGHHSGANHPDNYTINAAHKQFQGVLHQLENDDNPNFIVRQVGSDIRANIRANVNRL